MKQKSQVGTYGRSFLYMYKQLYLYHKIYQFQSTIRLRLHYFIRRHIDKGSLPLCSADMVKSMMDSIQQTSSSVSSDEGVSPLMSFVMGNDTNYKQKFYKPLLKRPSAGSKNEYIKNLTYTMVTPQVSYMYVTRSDKKGLITHDREV